MDGYITKGNKIAKAPMLYCIDRKNGRGLYMQERNGVLTAEWRKLKK